MQAADPLCDLQFEMASFYTLCMEIAAYFSNLYDRTPVYLYTKLEVFAYAFFKSAIVFLILS